MKKSRFVLMSLIMAAVLCLTPIGASAAGTAAAKTVSVSTLSVSLVFDGRELKLPEKQYSFIHENRVYVPVRYISYALLKRVGWDGKQVTVTEPTDAERQKLREHLLQAGTGTVKPQASQKLNVKPVQAKLVFSGKEKALPKGQEIFNYGGSIYVPVRFLAESVGTEIKWDNKAKTVSGESDAYKSEQGTGGEKPTDGNGSGTGGGTGTGSQPGTGGGTQPSAGTGGGVPGTGGGGTPVKLTYEQITADAEARIGELRSTCFTTLTSTYLDYKDATDAAVKEQLKARGQSELNSCTANFDAILSDTGTKLTANGYSTDILAEYRQKFDNIIAEAKKGLT